MSAGVHVWPRGTRDLHVLLHWERCYECKRQLHEDGRTLTCETYLKLLLAQATGRPDGREVGG